MLANRLKKVMIGITDGTQSSFLPNGLITNNVFLAIEIFHCLQKSSSTASHHMAYKLDINKVFDRARWNYLESLMQSMRFLLKFLSLIMCCLHSISYSILINGLHFESFSPNRGICQGHPISPYLFILSAEGLSSILRAAEERGVYGLPHRSGNYSITLRFANDYFLQRQTLAASNFDKYFLILWEALKSNH